MINSTYTGAIIALIGAVATFLAVFNIVIPTTQIDLIITSLIATYGAIHQIVVTKSANTQNIASGTVKQ